LSQPLPLARGLKLNGKVFPTYLPSYNICKETPSQMECPEAHQSN
jgi:hypothetical protein